MTRLEFRIPETIRLAWVSDDARSLRQPMIRKIARAWAEVEWRSVSAHLRRCALCLVSSTDFVTLAAQAAGCGLKAMPLRVEETRSFPGPTTMMLHVVIAKKRDAKEFKSAWIGGNSEAMGDLLGYPPCCRQFFQRIFVEQRLADPVWAIAQASRLSRRDDDSIILSGPPLLNLLLRSLGLRAIPHFPCSMDCLDSVALANRFMDLGKSLGYADEIQLLKEMLSWPAEWSALHGIAEIRTPIVKISTSTDATAEKLIIRWIGDGYPPDGAQGLAFPFKPLRLESPDIDLESLTVVRPQS